jgi:hypothetical protein
MSDLPRAELPVGLDDLIGLVHRLDPDGDALTHLGDAVMISERLGELGDHLIGHFVDQARKSGASWTAIGHGMGITKQAAQKRFVPGIDDQPRRADPQLFTQFTPRARQSISTAQSEARRMGNGQIGTEHLLLGLMSERGGLAARAVEALGASTKQVRSRVAAAGGPRVEEVPQQIPFAPRSKKVLERAAREALRLGHNYIGTEHLLLGILLDEESVGAKVLHELGITEDAVARWLTEELARIVADRQASG